MQRADEGSGDGQILSFRQTQPQNPTMFTQLLLDASSTSNDPYGAFLHTPSSSRGSDRGSSSMRDGSKRSSSTEGQNIAPQQHIQTHQQLAESQQSSTASGSQSSMGATTVGTYLAENLHEIIALQTYEGSWMMTNRIFELLECDRKETTHRVANLFAISYGMVPEDFPCGDEATVVTTLLVMGYLERKQLYSRSFWELAHINATQWVAAKLVVMKSRGEFQFRGKVLESIQGQITDLTDAGHLSNWKF
jgi:hypothetical protein